LERRSQAFGGIARAARRIVELNGFSIAESAERGTFF
jgi:hypothetical protein